MTATETRADYLRRRVDELRAKATRLEATEARAVRRLADILEADRIGEERLARAYRKPPEETQ